MVHPIDIIILTTLSMTYFGVEDEDIDVPFAPHVSPTMHCKHCVTDYKVETLWAKQ